ncbi:lytic transglycosylase domain-containing protein, partial [bacterium]|nr:lytic transglycosylase domain-containing protein [bacterium]
MNMRKILFLTLALPVFLSMPSYSLSSQDEILTKIKFKRNSTRIDKQKFCEEPSFTLLNSQDYNYLATYYATEYGVAPNLIKAIIKVESRGKPDSISHKGASGLMQLMPETAKSLGVKDIFDPGENIRAGVQYFKMMLDMFDQNVKL